jgi:hypothetical protein
MRCDERCTMRMEMYNLEISAPDVLSGFIYIHISLFNSISGRSRFYARITLSHADGIALRT